MTTTPVLEIAEFSLKEGTARSVFDAALAETNAVIRQFPGFVDRRTADLGGGRWIDVVEWRSLAEAKAAAEAFSPERHPGLAGFMALLDMSEGSMRHATIAARHPT